LGRAALGVIGSKCGGKAGGVDDAEIVALMPLVQGVAWRLWRRIGGKADLEELVSEGYVGLVKAVQTYKGDRGAKMETWAALRCRGAMIDWLRARDAVSRNERKKIGSAQVVCQFDDEAETEFEWGGKMSDVPSRFASPHEMLERAETRELLGAYDTRRERHREVMRLYFIEELPMREVAARVGCTESRVSQVVTAELAKLRRWMRSGTIGTARKMSNGGL